AAADQRREGPAPHHTSCARPGALPPNGRQFAAAHPQYGKSTLKKLICYKNRLRKRRFYATLGRRSYILISTIKI
ncbi:MAG: hypothetical protein AAF195_03550, partial [Pseudomonadota bacterium]